MTTRRVRLLWSWQPCAFASGDDSEDDGGHENGRGIAQVTSKSKEEQGVQIMIGSARGRMARRAYTHRDRRRRGSMRRRPATGSAENRNGQPVRPLLVFLWPLYSTCIPGSAHAHASRSSPIHVDRLWEWSTQSQGAERRKGKGWASWGSRTRDWRGRWVYARSVYAPPSDRAPTARRPTLGHGPPQARVHRGMRKTEHSAKEEEE